MARHDYQIANATGASVRADLNNALAAIQSVNSGSGTPSSTVAYQYFIDDSVTPALIKQRNAGDNGDILLGEVGGQSYFANGTQSEPSISFRNDTDLGFRRNDANKLSIVTGGADRVTVDASGNVGIGVTSVEANLHVEDTPNCNVQITSATSGRSRILLGDPGNTNVGRIQYDNSSNSLSFDTDDGTRLTILSDGKCGFGTTTPTERLHVNDNIFATGNIYAGATGTVPHNVTGDDDRARLKPNELSIASYQNPALKLNRTGSDGNVAAFFREAVQVGAISVTGSATAYNESSDYRLKENIVDITDGITRVKQLQPRRFNFIVDAETTVDGFIAHEAQTVVPEAVTGTHDEVDENGNPVMQGIDKSKFVPLLTAALQEAIDKIETLEAKVAALEAGN